MLTSENKKWLAEKIDDLIVAKGLIETFDGTAAKIVLNYIDNYIDKKLTLDSALVTSINEFIVAAKEEDYDKIEEVFTQVLDNLIDIPEIDDETELLIFTSAVKVIVGLVKKFVDSKTKES